MEQKEECERKGESEGTGKSLGTGAAKKSTSEDAIGAMKEATKQVILTGSPAYLKGKDNGNIHQIDEDSCERHVHFEDEAELGAFDVRILENITKD